jgi:GxxExxY protein
VVKLLGRWGNWCKAEAMREPNDSLSAKVIGAAIRVHQELGPGFLESFYEEALCIELELLGLCFQRQILVPVYYRERMLGEHRLDLLVEGELVVELKTVQGFESIHFATLRSYLKATKCSVGLLLNFAATKLGVKRVGREWHSRIR